MSNPSSKTVSHDWLKRLYIELVNLATAPNGTTFPSWILNGKEFGELRRISQESPDETKEDCPDCMKCLEQEERATAYADQLTDMVGVLVGQDMGEHSSENEPWENAIEALRLAIGSKQSSVETSGVDWVIPIYSGEPAPVMKWHKCPHGAYYPSEYCVPCAATPRPPSGPIPNVYPDMCKHGNKQTCAECSAEKASCIHRFDFVPFKGIICTQCGVPATTETVPVGHTTHHWVKQGSGSICDQCGLIRTSRPENGKAPHD